MGRDRRSTCSSTAKEPETSSETLPSPQNSDDLLGDGVNKPPPPPLFNGGHDIGRLTADDAVSHSGMKQACSASGALTASFTSFSLQIAFRRRLPRPRPSVKA